MARGLSRCSDFTGHQCPPAAAFSVVLTISSVLPAGINAFLPCVFHLVQ